MTVELAASQTSASKYRFPDGEVLRAADVAAGLKQLEAYANGAVPDAEGALLPDQSQPKPETSNTADFALWEGQLAEPEAAANTSDPLTHETGLRVSVEHMAPDEQARDIMAISALLAKGVRQGELTLAS